MTVKPLGHFGTFNFDLFVQVSAPLLQNEVQLDCLRVHPLSE